MRDEAIKELRKMLIEYLLSVDIDKLTKEELLEASIWMHHIYQPKTYEKNRKALQKVLEEEYKNL